MNPDAHTRPAGRTQLTPMHGVPPPRASQVPLPRAGLSSEAAPTDAASAAPGARHGRSWRWPPGLALPAVLLLAAAGMACQQRPQDEVRDASVTSAPMPAPPAGVAVPAPAAATRTTTVMQAQPDADNTSEAAAPAAAPSPATSGVPAQAPDTTGDAPGLAPVQVPPAPVSDGPLHVTAFGAAAIGGMPRAETPVGMDAPVAGAAAPLPQGAAAIGLQAAAMTASDGSAHDDQPPTTADAPEVREAWLARVRELLDAGDIAAGRASLAEFHRRHPQVDLPADLRALLD